MQCYALGFTENSRFPFSLLQLTSLGTTIKSIFLAGPKVLVVDLFLRNNFLAET